MATSTLRAPSSSRSRSKTILWISLGLTTLFVFITSEVLLVTDYPMYHAYRLQVIADRHLLIPHTLAGTFALLIGPINFSSRIRERHLKLHRVLGRIYVLSVFVGAFTGIALACGPPRFTRNLHAGRGLDRLHHRRLHHRAQPPHRPASSMDGPLLRRHIYLRLQPRAQPLAAYWSHLGDILSAVGVIAFTLASLLIVEIGLDWRELTTRRDLSPVRRP